MDGILPLYKAAGMSSHDCVAAIRKTLHIKQVGHSGTLDPQVDGVLPICIGQATKVVDYLLLQGKVYTGKVLLGQASETEDLEGAIIEQTQLQKPFTETAIKTAMAALTGDIVQIPPMYSAVKVNGRRLYDYARHNVPVERPKRPVHVYRFEYTNSTYDPQTKMQTIEFIAEVSKGTYIRTLAVDLGRNLGVPALMSQLTREKSGGFDLKETVTLEDFKAAVADQTASTLLYPIDRVLEQYPKYALSAEQWAQVQNGAFLEIHDLPELITLTYQGHIKALYQLRQKNPNVYKPKKMFLQNNGIG
ncbi:tRNA pseudouridine(55) synthase TruB [Agrilactobacillus yilanensis]|uniref:tRNA pseudouridine synthase B n=1 Tax=Agrilactobacillus yilanensis TaxID=2485997 RepID=A0ABW4J909_9LACO|nr:tRNA pseudouridine(55) synthase TruB [Agrilactobacillus yilanensis]